MGEPAEIRVEGSGHNVTGLWQEAADPIAVAVVAHGANNDVRHPFFAGVADGLVDGGVSVLRFNFPYMEVGRSYPDRPRTLMETWQAALEEAGRRADGRPVVAAGKSLGGRMASMVAAESPDRFSGSGLVFFGYPLHAPGRVDALRDSHLPSIRVPMLFIQGTADALARFDLIQGVVARFPDLARLHPIEGGDHSLRVRGHKRSDLEIGRQAASVAIAFIRDVVVVG